MFNKIYEVLKKIFATLKNILSKIFNDVVVIILDIILIILIFISIFIELPYGVYMPGGATSVITHLNNIKYETKGDIATTHVSFISGDILSLIGALIMPNWDIIKIEDIKYSHEELVDAEKRSVIDLYSSASIATVLAYEKAGEELEITSTDRFVTFIFEEAKTDLKVGDKIIKFNGKDYNPEEVAKYITTLELGDTIKLTVLRDEEEIETTSEIVEIEGGKYMGIVVTTILNFDKENVVTFEPEANSSGASGGLMMTLGIYNSLTKEDITKGRKICGTGTIDYNGTVGEISSVKYKVMGADKDKCDVFLVPEINYEEAKSTKDKFKYDLEIVSVNTLDEALEYLSK